MKTGTVNLLLHGGKAPAWLFSRMVKLSRQILLLMASEHGTAEILKRVSEPLWFQALGCVLGFDWHSSGVTTTVCGALKEAAKGLEKDTGLHIAGGKGAASRKTPIEIVSVGEKNQIDLSSLVYNSRISAKVDSNALQDGYQLYHHCFFFTADAKQWAVVQQGMNIETRLARRYHWLGTDVNDFVCEPHSAVCCDRRGEVLNLVDRQSAESRNIITGLSCEKPGTVLKDFDILKSSAYKMIKKCENNYDMPLRHNIISADINRKRFEKILISTYAEKPQNFEALLSMPGVGPGTIRALALISELVYGIKHSITDPARFSFAHGGKDGIPYPVDRRGYDRSIEILEKAVRESRIENREKINALRRLELFYR